MTAMGTEVLVGLIGLGGAVVGAAAAFFGVVYQQRHQAALADRQRRIERSESAVDVLITELEALRHHAWTRPEDESAPRTDWTAEMGRILDRMHLAALRLEDRDLRETLEAAMLFGFGNEEHLQQAIGLRAGRPLMVAMSTEAQKCLGYYLRQEPVPSTRFLTVARQQHDVLLDHRPEAEVSEAAVRPGDSASSLPARLASAVRRRLRQSQGHRPR